jgi:hypothetical protein
MIMKDKTLLLASIMLISVGASSVVHANVAACAHQKNSTHKAGYCKGYMVGKYEVPNTCWTCVQDSDTVGGCVGPKDQTTECKQVSIKHPHTPLTYHPYGPMVTIQVPVPEVGTIPISLHIYAKCDKGTPKDATRYNGAPDGDCKPKKKAVVGGGGTSN